MSFHEQRPNGRREAPAPYRYQGPGSGRENGHLPPRPRSPPPRHDRGDSYRPFHGGYDQPQSYGGYGRDGNRDAQNSYYPPPPTFPPAPGYGSHAPTQQYDSYRQDSYRPPQGDFTFRSEQPPGITAARNDQNYNASSRGGPPRDVDRERERYRRRPRPDQGGNRGGFSRPFTSLPVNRPILTATSTAVTEDFANTATGITYKTVIDVSDGEEADMGTEGSVGPSRKKARTVAEQPASVPKWSNPDVYSVLPGESVTKKTDVVGMIRNARVESISTAASAPVEPSTADEFIPFEDSDDDTEMPNAAPKSLSELRGGADSDKRGPNKPPLAPSSRAAEKVVTPNPRAAETSTNLNPGRKRTHNDQIKKPELPPHAKLKKGTKMPVGGFISAEWRVTPDEPPCPWVRDHSDTTHMGTWLHKEVVDFYEHVRPRDFEQRLRQELINALNQRLKTRFKNAEIRAFGSFMSGLYLPTGDMDLVFCTRQYLKSGQPGVNLKKVLFQFRAFLVEAKFANEEDIELVIGAKVPLVKYIDGTTGLKVDVSFENLGGVKAIQTFLDWKTQYPVMPLLVTLIKHFLAMRGLNEPMNGGIGGFSVICLVVSMLQHMPPVQSRDMIPEHHLGQMLMEFFDLYGNKFQYEDIAISLNPPAYIPKNKVLSQTYKNVDRLSIIDPNNPKNDISGGSKNIAVILRVFSEAQAALQKRMVTLAQAPAAARKNASILSVIFEGNYSSFRAQREHLRQLYDMHVS